MERGEFMPRCAREKSEHGIYHIMLRGANRQEIFHDDADRLRFMETVKRYKKTSAIEVYGWCLMGNHVHLLLKEGKEEISETMKRIGVSFVWYYNRKYLTTGHLFQDRFNSEGVDSLEYLRTVIRYIHQNPVKAGLVQMPEEWKWSSCSGYYGQGSMPKGLLDCEFILYLFADNMELARMRFKEFNQAANDDRCLDLEQKKRLRYTDEEARRRIIMVLGGISISQVKGLPKPDRDELLRKVKKVKGISQRQAARILGVSPNLVFKA